MQLLRLAYLLLINLSFYGICQGADTPAHAAEIVNAKTQQSVKAVQTKVDVSKTAGQAMAATKKAIKPYVEVVEQVERWYKKKNTSRFLLRVRITLKDGLTKQLIGSIHGVVICGQMTGKEKASIGDCFVDPLYSSKKYTPLLEMLFHRAAGIDIPCSYETVAIPWPDYGKQAFCYDDYVHNVAGSCLRISFVDVQPLLGTKITPPDIEQHELCQAASSLESTSWYMSSFSSKTMGAGYGRLLFECIKQECYVCEPMFKMQWLVVPIDNGNGQCKTKKELFEIYKKLGGVVVKGDRMECSLIKSRL